VDDALTPAANTSPTQAGENLDLIAELELALHAARSQQAFIRESLTTVIDYLDRHPGA